MALHPLPAPDFLEFTLPEGHCCLITDDGSRTSVALAEQLAQQGWDVVLLSFSPTVIEPEPRKIPSDIAHVTLDTMTEAALQKTLGAVADAHGPVSAFVHVHPVFDENMLFDKRERSIVKQVFLAAKHLQPALTGAATQGRAVFMTVTRLDGALGLDGTQTYGAIGAGLPGLTKSLSLEWQHVFCRAVDLDPTISAESAAQTISAEMHDPDRLIIEVGCGPKGRVTVKRSPQERMEHA